jgi:hypothetical protein
MWSEVCRKRSRSIYTGMLQELCHSDSQEGKFCVILQTDVLFSINWKWGLSVSKVKLKLIATSGTLVKKSPDFMRGVGFVYYIYLFIYLFL